MKRTGVLLVVLALSAFLAAPAGADDPPQFIYPIEHDEYTVEVGETVDLGGRWGACSPGLVRQATRALHFHYYVYDVDNQEEPIGEVSGWSPPAFEEWEGLNCMGGRDLGGVWLAYATFPYEFEKAGVYWVKVEVFLDHRATDGLDMNPADGRLDFYGPGLFQTAIATVSVGAQP